MGVKGAAGARTYVPRRSDAALKPIGDDAALARRGEDQTLNDVKGRSSPDNLEAENASHGFLKAIPHDCGGDISTLGQQFVLKLCRIGLRQVNFVRMPAGAAKLLGGSGNAGFECHGFYCTRRKYERGPNLRPQSHLTSH